MRHFVALKVHLTLTLEPRCLVGCLVKVNMGVLLVVCERVSCWVGCVFVAMLLKCKVALVEC